MKALVGHLSLKATSFSFAKAFEKVALKRISLDDHFTLALGVERAAIVLYLNVYIHIYACVCERVR